MSAARRVVLIAIILATFGMVAGDVGAAPLTGVDLSSYHRVGRYDLPSATTGNQLAAEASAVAYDADDDSLYVVGDEGTGIVRVSKTGVQLSTMALAPGAFEDTEGLAYLGGGEFALTEERLRQVDKFTYVAGGTLARADVESVTLGTTVGNVGLEGVSNDPTVAGGLLLVKEKTPESVFSTSVDWALGTATNGGPSATDATDLFTPSLAGLDDFSDVFALANLSTLTGVDASHLLMISQESGKIINVDRSGGVSSSLTIRRDADNALSVPDQTMEGLTLDEDGTLYVVNEGGGGAGHPQLWVYAPTATPNAAPTAVALAGATTSLPEDANTTTRRKVASIDVTDADGLGVNAVGVTGPDAASFEADATGLYLKAGVVLDYEAKTSYSVSVTVDDTTVGTTPDATSNAYTLSITDVVGEGGTGSGDVVVSEVAPWGSGDAVGADWWELTNTGDTTVDLTGWKVDDSSNDGNVAVALGGVTSLAPGASAVFLEGDATKVEAFKTAWSGGAVPAGLKVGSYSGAGIGLSTNGDAVVIFNAVGDRVTGVQFGAATTGVSFDNAAGAGDTGSPLPAISALSVAGGAGAAANGAGEVGSPGAIDWPLVVTEVSPTSSSGASYAADWFEVTNTGSVTVPLAGWKVDDDSATYGSAVPLTDVASLAPGASAVFVEGDATKEPAFRTAWFGSATGAAGVSVGAYTGGGIGLGSGGDQVNVYDTAGKKVDGVAFGAATSSKSFDNSAGATTLTVVSARGVHGAFVAGGETGSPGTIADDVAAPAVTFSGASATYAYDDPITILCAAADEARGSGVASTTCADVTGVASSFGVGAHTITATATDYAGNVGTASVTFTVLAAPVVKGPAPKPPVVTAPPVASPLPLTFPLKPKLTVPSSAKPASLAKGITLKLANLTPKSRVTLTVKLATKTITTVKTTANAAGAASLKLKLTAAQRAKVRGKRLTLRWTYTGRDGQVTKTTTLKVTRS